MSSIKDKITQGPWSFNGNEVTANNGKRYICGAESDDGDVEYTNEERANAVAISRIPRMLAALEKVVKEFDSADNHAHQKNAIEEIKELLTY